MESHGCLRWAEQCLQRMHLVWSAIPGLEMVFSPSQVLYSPMLRGKQAGIFGCVSGRAVGESFGTGTRASKGRAATVAAGKGLVVRTERRFRIAWKAYLAELVAMQMAEHPTEAAVAERKRQ